jgi:hypothetical protein
MEIHNVLKKVEQKLAASSDNDLAKQKFDFEMGELALTCIKNKRATSAANNSWHSKSANLLTKTSEILLNDLGPVPALAQAPSGIKDKILGFLNSTGGKTLGYGLGGTAAGSLLGSYFTADKSENETEDQYKKRKMDSALTGGIAGAALGVSAPSIIDNIKSLSGLGDKPQEGAVKKTIESVAGSVINPTAVTVGGGVAAGGALNKFLSFLNKDEIAALTTKITGDPKNKNDKFFIDQISKLKGMTPLIEKLKPVEIPFRRTLTQQLPEKMFPILNKVLAQSTRGRLLLAGGGLAALAGKKYLDTSFFNEPALK